MKVPVRDIEALESRIAPATLVGLDEFNHLLSFDSSTPGTVTEIAVSGLAAGETLIGIDVRPATGALYGVAVDGSGQGHVYVINPTTGTATTSALLAPDPADATSPFTGITGPVHGVDIDPVSGALRIVTAVNQNLRVNLDTGLVVTEETLNPAVSVIAGAAHSNAFAGTTTTTLYDIDTTSDSLLIQSPPGDGTLTSPKALGVDATGNVGFDILSTRTANGTATNTAYAALTVGGTTGLYTIDLASGAAVHSGAIGTGAKPLAGLTALTSAPSAKAYTVDAATKHLLAFNTATPNSTSDLGAITGIGGNEAIIGFDFSPTNGSLYLVTKDTTSSAGRLYTLDPQSATVTLVATLSAEPTDTSAPYTTLSGINFGIDFNPTNGRLRIVSEAGENLRVDVSTGRVTTDGNLNGAVTSATAAAYDSNFGGATATTLFVIDATSDKLFTQNPTTGALTLVGDLGHNASAVNGFDIRTNGEAFATLTVGSVASLYKINLQSGAATPVGAVGSGATETLGLALAPSGAFSLASSSLLVKEGANFASITIQRTGGSDGVSSVLVKTSDTGATAGADYTAFSQVVTFAAGETSKTIQVPIANDTAVEGNESFLVTLSEPAGGAALGATKKTIVTVADDDANLIALDANNHLLKFSSAAPGTVSSNVAVTGLGNGETLVGIDFRPATGALYGVALGANGAGKLYLINPTTGVATLVAALTEDTTDTTDGNAQYTALSGTNFAVDFNPSADRLRLLSDSGLNLRINVDTGAVITDTSFDPAGGVRSGAAYSSSFAAAGSTTLYDIDVTNDRLVIQNPNAGTVTVVGALGVDATGVSGFDIISTRGADGTTADFAFATLTVGGTTGLYAIDLTTGAATALGNVGDSATPLAGLTSPLAAPAAKAFTIDANKNLLSFSTATPNATTTIGQITNIPAGETIIGFDFRPANGQLYLVTKNGSDAARLYTVSTTTGAAISVGTLLPDGTDTTTPYSKLSGTSFGVDFEPTRDRLRIVSDTGQNLRINVDALTVITDATLNGAPTPGATGAAYDQNSAGGANASLFVINPATDTLYLQSPADNGTLVVRGALGVDATAVGGFDIRATGEAFATLTVDGVSSLYEIDLVSGQATLVGNLGTAGAGAATLGFALAPAGTFQFSAATTNVDETAGMVTLTINRVGGSEGLATVVVNTSDLTATAGADYTAKTQVLTFAAGETSRTIQVPILDDGFFEGNETFKATLSDATGGTGFGTNGAITVTINDSETKPTLSINDVKVSEGNGDGTMTFTVTLSGPSATATSFHYTTGPGSATEGPANVNTPGADYIAAVGDLTIPAGQTTATIQVSIKGDFIEESNETFRVDLSALQGNATLGDASGTGTLLNDDATRTADRTLTYRDLDGDRVTVRLSGTGTLDETNYVFQPVGTLGGVQLVELDISDAEFAGANITITAARGTSGGDGFVNIGYLDATGNALGNINIRGDLGRIDAGAVKSLTVGSLGLFGTSTQSTGGSLNSALTGTLGKLVVRTQMLGAKLSVTGDLGSATIGSMSDAELHATGRIGSLGVLGTVADTKISAKSAGAVKISGDLEGSSIYLLGQTAPPPAQVLVLKSLNVGGSVTGSNILAGFDAAGNASKADVSIGSVVVGRDWQASNLSAGVRAGNDGIYGTGDDAVISGGVPSTIARIASITIKGQVSGTVNNATDGFGFVAEQIGIFRTGGVKLPLVSAIKDEFAVGATGDVRIREAVLI